MIPKIDTCFNIKFFNVSWILGVLPLKEITITRSSSFNILEIAEKSVSPDNKKLGLSNKNNSLENSFAKLFCVNPVA